MTIENLITERELTAQCFEELNIGDFDKIHYFQSKDFERNVRRVRRNLK